MKDIFKLWHLSDQEDGEICSRVNQRLIGDLPLGAMFSDGGDAEQIPNECYYYHEIWGGLTRLQPLLDDPQLLDPESVRDVETEMPMWLERIYDPAVSLSIETWLSMALNGYVEADVFCPARPDDERELATALVERVFARSLRVCLVDWHGAYFGSDDSEEIIPDVASLVEWMRGYEDIWAVCLSKLKHVVVPVHLAAAGAMEGRIESQKLSVAALQRAFASCAPMFDASEQKALLEAYAQSLEKLVLQGEPMVCGFHVEEFQSMYDGHLAAVVSDIRELTTGKGKSVRFTKK